MTEKQCIQELKVENQSCLLHLQGEFPFVEFNQQTYSFLWQLLHVLPTLSDPKNIDLFAQISNFYWKAGKFQYIHAIEEYQKFYTDRIKQEKTNPDAHFDYKLTDYKIFDVSVLHAPQIESNQAIYFTYDSSTYIPYRVTCAFPYHQKQAVHYQILPIIN